MSIFKESFKPNIQAQLKKRQEAINDRTPQNLTYYNSRNSWIRMSSAVDVYKSTAPQNPTIEQLKDAANYDNSLSKKYISQIFGISDVTISKTFRKIWPYHKILLSNTITNLIIEKKKLIKPVIDTCTA